MKSLFVIALLTITGCTQLMKGAEQPVVQYRDSKTFKTTCSGAAEDWGSCFRKAKRTCTNGYEVVERNNDNRGIIREIIFTCNK